MKEKKEKEKKATSKKKTKDKSTAPSTPSGGAFKKNVEVQTMQLRAALQQQMQATQEVRQEMSALNETFEIEVEKRKKAEEELAEMSRQLSFLTSKARGLEKQLNDERKKTEATKRGVIDPRKRSIAAFLPPPS